MLWIENAMDGPNERNIFNGKKKKIFSVYETKLTCVFGGKWNVYKGKVRSLSLMVNFL